MTLKRIVLIAATIVTGLIAIGAVLNAILPPVRPSFGEPHPIMSAIATAFWMVLFGHFLHRVLTGHWRWWRSVSSDDVGGTNGR